MIGKKKDLEINIEMIGSLTEALFVFDSEEFTIDTSRIFETINNFDELIKPFKYLFKGFSGIETDYIKTELLNIIKSFIRTAISYSEVKTIKKLSAVQVLHSVANLQNAIGYEKTLMIITRIIEM